jgi:hypothetical protein
MEGEFLKISKRITSFVFFTEDKDYYTIQIAPAKKDPSPITMELCTPEFKMEFKMTAK